MKKILFVLIAGLFAVMVIGCSKTEELAAVMEVTVKYYDANQNLQTLRLPSDFDSECGKCPFIRGIS